jgi:hypothetical protein
MADTYQLPGLVAMPAPALTGRYLAHTQQSRVCRAFLASELHRGTKRLDKPTMSQCAYLARVSTAYAWAAEKRMAERAVIEAGYVPLVPASPISKANGSALPMSITGIPDRDLVDFVRSVGVNRVIEAACAVEAAQ